MMSLSSLANSAAARRSDIGPTNVVPSSINEVAAAASTPPDKAPPTPQVASNTDVGVNLLVGYIPTEIITVYLAVVAALQPSSDSAARSAALALTNGTAAGSTSWQTEWITFVIFAAATPVVFWLIHLGKLRAAGKSMSVNSLPLWEPTAALIAFVAWAFALPDSPFRYFEDWYSPGLAGIAVLSVSTALGLLAPLFQNQLQP